MAIDFSELNRAIKAWEVRTLAKVKATGSKMGVRHRTDSPSTGDSLAALKSKDSKTAGDLISSITFTFARSLVYPYYGAGKGRGGAKGSSWIGPHGIRRKTNPKSLGKAGTGGRVAKPFFDEIGSDLNELADIVTEKTGDVIVANIFGNTKTGK